MADSNGNGKAKLLKGDVAELTAMIRQTQTRVHRVGVLVGQIDSKRLVTRLRVLFGSNGGSTTDDQTG